MSLRRPARRSPESSFGGIAAAETVPSDDGHDQGCAEPLEPGSSPQTWPRPMSHRLVLDGGGQRHSLTYSCCPGSRGLPLPRMYFQGRIRLFGAEDRRQKPRSCDMPGIPNQVVVVTGNQEVVTEALGHSWRPRPTGRPDGVSPERPGCPKTDPPRRPVRV